MVARGQKSFSARSPIAGLLMSAVAVILLQYCTRRRLYSCTEFCCARGEPLVLSIGSGHSAQVLVRACARPADAAGSGCAG